MSENEPRQNPEPETTILHLNKFVPGPAPAPAPHSASADDGVTIFIAKAAAETCQETKVIVPKDAGSVPAASMMGWKTVLP